MSYRFLIIGAGLSGSVLARELVSQLDCHVEIWEKERHIAGHCYTYEDGETGIMVHQHGPHIFNTDKKELWDYFNRYSPLRPYIHKVKAVHNGKIYSLPVNLNTLNQFYGKSFTPKEAREFIQSIGDYSIKKPKNFEEQAIHLLGKELYRAFFYGYTKKQWGCEPDILPVSVLKRLPVRFDYNDNYHLHPYTGIPEKGYTHFVEQLLDHPKIHLKLRQKFEFTGTLPEGFRHVFYSGPLDTFFDYCAGRLSYRTLHFEKEVLDGNFQEYAQINYCDENIPFTRITEHKFFTPWKKFDKTIIFREYSSEAGRNDIPYYPKRLKEDSAKLEAYHYLANHLQRISFLGRLGTYRYMDMQHVIGESINLVKTLSEHIKLKKQLPVFLPIEHSGT